MERILAIFISWQATLLALGVFSIIHAVRSLKPVKDSKWFNSFLPLYPYILSLCLVYVPSFPFPEGVEVSASTKILFACYAAWISDKSFQITKSILKKGFGISDERKDS